MPAPEPRSPGGTILRPRRRSEEEEQAGEDRRTASLAGLAVALLLVVVGLMLVHALRHEAQLEDCLLAGRTDCNLVAPGPAWPGPP